MVGTRITVKLLLALVVLALSLMLCRDLFAEKECGCYCGKWIDAPCSDQACKDACGYQEPSSGSNGSSSNQEAERQKQQEEQKKQEEAERQKKLEEQKQKEAEEAKKKQEEFARKNQEVLKSMKSISENELGLKGTGESGGLGLKGSNGAANSGLKEAEAPGAPSKPAENKAVVSEPGPGKCVANCELPPV